MKYGFWILGLSLMGNASAQGIKNVVVDANAEQRKVPQFHAIDVSGGMDVYLSQGKQQGVAISTDSRDQNHLIHTEVIDGILKIYFSNGSFSWNSKAKAYITCTQLDRLGSHGACNVRIFDTLMAKSLSIEFSGASDCKGGLIAQHLDLSASGACNLNLAGQIDKGKIELSGASRLKGYGLRFNTCTVEASGASGVSITVNKELSATASGASTIFYAGNCIVKDVDATGGSTIKRRELK